MFEALKFKADNPVLYNVARNKLKLWNLTDDQIDRIESGGKPKQEIDVLSPLSGVVTKRNTSIGSYVKEGDQLFEIVDLSVIWLVFNAYETDLSWINKNDKISFKLNAMPGKVFNAKVNFIDPLIDPKTRTAAIRVNFNNSDKQIKPEMFAEGTLIANIPIDEPKIIIPKSAVMYTGKRSIVYTKVFGAKTPTFKYREVTLGLDLGAHYIILKGLEENEEVVINGAFQVDAAAQLAGKSSMMNQSGGKVETGHNH